MTGRNESFGADPESSSSVLRSLGYSEEEISGTPGEGTPDDLRLSLRQLSESRAHETMSRAEQSATVPPNPRLHQNQTGTPNNADYWQGRKDAAILNKDNMNPGGGTPGTRKSRTPKQPESGQQIRQTLKQLGKIAKTFGGGSGSAGKTLGGVARAQRARRR
jgi:hypothetical protein